MDENASNESVFTEADEQAFDSGWDDEAMGGTGYEETSETGDEANQETESGGEDQPAAEETGSAEAQEQGEEPEQKPDSDSFELKYMGETKTVGREEAVVLAQKGLDYDRIRQERDSMSTELEGLRADKAKLTEYEDFLGKLALSVGADIPTMMESTRAKMLVADEKKKGNEISEEFAREKIRFEREKADFERQKAGKQQPAAEAEAKPEEPKTSEDAAKAKRDDEAAAFLKAYPDVDPKSIPKEVINQWRGGTPLVTAYMTYENKKLKADLAAMEQNKKNGERSTGSAKSAGAGKGKDAFDMGWDSI